MMPTQFFYCFFLTLWLCYIP